VPHSFASRCAPRLDVAPFRLSGTVVAALLNHRRSLAALGDAVHAPPYKSPPKAVVLAIKPPGALVRAGEALLVDDAATELEIGATLGVVIASTACAVAEADALSHVGAYLVVADAALPRASHYRPQIRAMARDSSCALGSSAAPRDDIRDPDVLTMRTFVDGALAATASTAELIRPVARLIADISDFMTLHPGDVLLVGGAADLPRVRAGARVVIEIDRVGRLETHVALAERSAA